MKSIILSLFFATSLNSFAGLFSSRSLCRDLSIGESFKVKNERETGVAGNYILKRLTEDRYEVFVNFDFTFNKGSQNSSAYNSYSKVRERINFCYKKYKKALRDEQGREIKLSLWHKGLDGIKKPKAEKVKLIDPNIRSSSDKWSLDLNCFTVVHETLHQLGLVDEYEEIIMENSKGEKIYDCRAIGRTDSLMGGIIKDTSSPALFPIHLNSIIYPGCKKKNRLYYSCSKNAYRTGSCKDMDSRCYDSSWVLN
ncbi:hypothetical protein HBN50_06710 [Halobacteriovorax sp. GB3]|uniref:hypothetical protein n=1 Tax=Halobacteriovorax sp. GB3 TaxID=2719615 RepID=UPI00235EDC8F|nr:hypothetical protein [Halobacteriovorax sp. GB3]MDD0852778.1 hypothetical protein [Halobacteriovorax sp. GB3]